MRGYFLKKILSKIDDIDIRPIDIAIVSLLVLLICVVNVTNQDLVVSPDLRFLYNRATQMYKCLCDGNIPFFYYDDFGGVGYGSSFFYGDLTLYPFLFTVKFGIKKFLLAYTSTTIILTYLGASYFAKRFTKSYKFTALIYMCCAYTLQSFYMFGTYANLLAIAISFFFLAKCVDFFRDNKSFIPASILFFIILNTHSVTALLSFILCCIIMIFYFSKDKFFSYIKFASVTCLICSYFIINMIYHSDILTSIENINKAMLDYAKRGDISVISNYMSYLPMIGTVELLILTLLGIDIGVTGYRLFNLTLTIVLIALFIKRIKTFSKKEVICLFSIIFSLVIAERHIWVFLNSIYQTHIQFPIRYMPYSILILLIILFRYLDKRWVKVVTFTFCLLDCFLIGFMTSGIVDKEQYNDLFCQVENGEYLDKSFVWKTDTFHYYSSHVIDQDGAEYDYTSNKGVVTIKFKGNSSNIKSLLLPKLYYKGYECYYIDKSGSLDEKKYLPVTKGYSQFIKVDMTDFKGDYICLRYKHPNLLVLLWVFCDCTVLFLMIYKLGFRKRR